MPFDRRLIDKGQLMQFMIKPPLVEPVSIEEVKKWLKIETQDEDEILLTLIISARLYIEQVVPRQWRCSAR